MLAEDRALGIGIFPSARPGFFDIATGSARHTGRHPADDPYPFNILHMAYFGVLAVHPNHERFAVLTRHGSRIEFYNGDGEPVAETDGPHPFPVDYEVDRGGHMVRGLRNRQRKLGLAGAAWAGARPPTTIVA